MKGFAFLLGSCLLLLNVLYCNAFLENIVDAAKELIADFSGSTATAPSSRATPNNAPGVSVADFSHTGLPKVRTGARVVDLVNGIHWDDLRQDSPDGIRPPSVVAFYDSSDQQCMKKYNQLNWDVVAENHLPARERIMTARYDMYAAPIRPWYKFTPEMDLAKRFNVDACPQVVFAPRSCNGWTEWCSRGPDPSDPAVELIGCEDFKEQCTNTVTWDGKGDLAKWVRDLIEADGEPMISSFFGTYEEQGLWMQKRDHTTTDNQLRNMYLSQAFPAFSHRGFKVMPIPEKVNEYLQSFYNRTEKYRRTEWWDAESTQLSFHETPTTFLDMDRERFEKERIANEYLKPLVEEWANINDLELTSFYGMREYPNGSWLKNHVDRIDTHVLSLTISVRKLNPKLADEKPWPLEVIDWNGDHVRYNHPGGTLILYESSKLPHGRPFRNNGGVHVGCFAHFKPRSMHTADASKWESIVRTARSNQRMNTQHARYVSTPSVEPEDPQYSKVNYGEGTHWKHLGEVDTKSANAPDLTVLFRNEAERPMDVYWSSHEGDHVHQGTVSPGASFSVNTFRGHKFFWAEKDTQIPVPGGHMTMEKGRTEYKFNVAR